MAWPPMVGIGGPKQSDLRTLGRSGEMHRGRIHTQHKTGAVEHGGELEQAELTCEISRDLHERLNFCQVGRFHGIGRSGEDDR